MAGFLQFFQPNTYSLIDPTELLLPIKNYAHKIEVFFIERDDRKVRGPGNKCMKFVLEKIEEKKFSQIINDYKRAPYHQLFTLSS